MPDSTPNPNESPKEPRAHGAPLAKPPLTLATSRPLRLVTLCAMYLAQGIPWGFMAVALAAYLAEKGISRGEVGQITGMILLPWTFKLVWAPLIDSVTIPSMGRRRPWIIGAQLMMAASLLGLVMMGDVAGNLTLLGWMFFLHNCFASLQDVSTDALAVDILPPEEQGRANGLMWGTKLVGYGIGGYGLSEVLVRFGLEAAVFAQILGLLAIMLLPILLLERPGERRLPSRRNREFHRASTDPSGNPSGLRNPAEVLGDLVKAFSLVTTSVFFLFGVVHVIGWGIIEIITKTLYIQELDWEAVEFTRVSAGIAVFSKFAGALLGGLLADRIGRRTVMVVGFGGYGLLAIVFASCGNLWHERWFTSSYLLVIEGALAMGSVGFLSMSMRISWTKAAATVFTVFMTVSNVGHVVGNFVVGPLKQAGLDYQATFYVAGLTMILPLLLLFVVKPQVVDRLKTEDLRSRDEAAAGADAVESNAADVPAADSPGFDRR